MNNNTFIMDAINIKINSNKSMILDKLLTHSSMIKWLFYHIWAEPNNHIHSRMSRPSWIIIRHIEQMVREKVHTYKQ